MDIPILSDQERKTRTTGVLEKQKKSLDKADPTLVWSINDWPEIYKNHLDKVKFTDRMRYAQRLV